MTTSDKGIALIKRLEGCSTVAYRDVAGYWTIGVGHLLTKSESASGKVIINGKYVRWKDGLTPQQCDDLLRQDLHETEMCLHGYTTPRISQNQYDALVSFTFNVGCSAFRGSTLRKMVNMGRFDEVPAQLMRWVYAGGKEVTGLKNRRVYESKMWNGELE
jgi:lysozyme